MSIRKYRSFGRMIRRVKDYDEYAKPMTPKRATNILRYTTRRLRKQNESKPFICAVTGFHNAWMWSPKSSGYVLKSIFEYFGA